MREVAEHAAVVLGAGVAGVLLGQLREIVAASDLFASFAGFVLGLDQDVAGLDFFFGLHALDLVFVDGLGGRFADRTP